VVSHRNFQDVAGSSKIATTHSEKMAATWVDSGFRLRTLHEPTTVPEMGTVCAPTLQLVIHLSLPGVWGGIDCQTTIASLDSSTSFARFVLSFTASAKTSPNVA
jgi:hypothetical protein